MEYKRWYDNTSGLKDIFAFIESLDVSFQQKIAQDIIQILMNDFHLDLDAQLNNISKSYNFKCSRWYDNNIDLFSSFEIIKNLSDELKNEIVDKIAESIFLMHLEKIK